MSKSAKQYNTYAKEYDELSRTAAPWVYLDKPTIEKELVPLFTPRNKILEMGCGGGKVMEFLHIHGIAQKNMVGVDSSENLLELAKKHLPGARFILGDVSNEKILPSKDFFDAVISVRVLEYLTLTDLEKAMTTAFQALKVRGLFFIIVGHPLRVNNGDLSRYLERGWRSVSLPWGMKVELYHKTISDYITASIKAGFTISLIDETLPPADLQRKDPDVYKNYASYGATNLVLVLKKL